MTERQAWAALAKGVSNGRFANGLCAALPCLFEGCYVCPNSPLRLRVTRAVAGRMRSRIDKLPNRYRLYKWSFNPNGQLARAAFCRRQVRRLTLKRKSAPKRNAKR